MSSTGVRWAIAGWGVGGRVFHAPLLDCARGVVWTAVVASTRHAHDPALQNVTRVESVQHLAAAGVEAVTVTTPAGSHEELALTALRSGLHVVVDKPFALTGAGARSLVDAARAHGRTLSVFQNRRTDGDFLTIARLHREGALGDAVRFTNRIRRLRPPLPAWNDSAPARQGGGTLLDLAPHLIDQAHVLLGRVTAVSAVLTRVADANAAMTDAAENDLLLLLRHESGPLSVIEASVAAATQGPRMQLDGSLGGVSVDGFDVQEADLVAGRRPDDLGDEWGREPNDRTAAVTTTSARWRQQLERGRWTDYYPALAHAIRSGAPAPLDPVGAVHTADIVDAARVSHTRGEWVRVPRPEDPPLMVTTAPKVGD